MPAEPATEEPATRPDWALVLNGRLPDGGPRYVETPADPTAPDAPFVAEPWNTVTASFFIWIALAWLWRLRGRYRDYPFMVACMPILLAGGIGGTLFHGTRTARLYFLLDVIPISLLGLAGAVFMAFRYFGRARMWMLVLLVVFYAAMNRLFFSMLGPMNRQLSINLSYASLAVVVLTVPHAAQFATAESVADRLAGKILIDVTVPLSPPKVDKVQLPNGESAVVALMRSQMKASSFRMWRKRMKGRVTKHAALRPEAMNNSGPHIARHRIAQR